MTISLEDQLVSWLHSFVNHNESTIRKYSAKGAVAVEMEQAQPITTHDPSYS